MVFCLRYVDDNLEVHEDTLGFYNLERTDAAYIMTVLQDTLLRFNLHISNCHGQCYDGAGIYLEWRYQTLHFLFFIL